MAIPTTGNPGSRPGVNSTHDSLRALIGDTAWVEYSPSNADYVNYAQFSDAELDSFLLAGGASLPSAVGYAYLKLAGASAGNAVDWASDDLKVTMSKQPAAILAIADSWFARGGADAADIFEFADVPSMYDTDYDIFAPEGASPSYYWRWRDSSGYGEDTYGDGG